MSALAAEIRAVGIGGGSLVMVHASMRKVGFVAGGVLGLIEALRAAIGDAGTMMMVLGDDDRWSWVNNYPEEQRTELLAAAPPFDCSTSPAQSDVGVLAEMFRGYPGTVVSDHPEGRFAANGPLAGELLRDPPWHNYYGPDSPLDRFQQRSGQVLRLGADRDTVTLTHFAEYLAEVANKRAVRRYRRVLGEHGPVTTFVDALDDSNGIVEYRDGTGTEIDYFPPILDAFCQHYHQDPAVLSIGRVGGALAERLDGATWVRFATGWMNDNLR